MRIGFELCFHSHLWRSELQTLCDPNGKWRNYMTFVKYIRWRVSLQWFQFPRNSIYTCDRSPSHPTWWSCWRGSFWPTWGSRWDLLWAPCNLHHQPRLGVDDAVIYLLQRAHLHLDGGGASVRITYLDFSSVFNTIQPLLLSKKLQPMCPIGLCSVWCGGGMVQEFLRELCCLPSCSHYIPQISIRFSSSCIASITMQIVSRRFTETQIMTWTNIMN